jgi:hypothetical protein
METARAEANKNKRRRMSNQLRGDNAVEIRIESEKEAERTGEKVKSYVKCCEDAGFKTNNPRTDLCKKIKKMKSVTDSAMNTPTALSEDEKEDDDNNEETMAGTPKDWENNEQYWCEKFSSQVARSEVSGARKREGTQEEKKAATEFNRTHPVKNLFQTQDEYSTAIAEATLEISETAIGAKTDKAREIVSTKFTDRFGNEQVTPKHLVKMARSNPGVKPRSQGAPHLTADEEKAVAEFVNTCRARHVPVTPEYILKSLNQALETSPDIERQMLLKVITAKNKGSYGITKGILEGFYRRQGFQTAYSESLDVQRQLWTTAKNGAFSFIIFILLFYSDLFYCILILL